MKYEDGILILSQNDIFYAHHVVNFSVLFLQLTVFKYLVASHVTEPGSLLTEPGAVIKFSHFCSPPVHVCYNESYFFNGSVLWPNIWPAPCLLILRVNPIGRCHLFYPCHRSIHFGDRFIGCRCALALSWWRHQIETLSALLGLCAGNSSVTGEFHSHSQWRWALMFSLICTWINGWANNREVGDLRRHRAHYDVIVMSWILYESIEYKSALIQVMTHKQQEIIQVPLRHKVSLRADTFPKVIVTRCICCNL